MRELTTAITRARIAGSLSSSATEAGSGASSGLPSSVTMPVPPGLASHDQVDFGEPDRRRHEAISVLEPVDVEVLAQDAGEEIRRLASCGDAGERARDLGVHLVEVELRCRPRLDPCAAAEIDPTRFGLA